MTNKPWHHAPLSIVAVTAAFILSLPACAESPIVGAGSSAAHPVYKAWADYHTKSGGAVLNYDPAGSSAGLKRIRAREVDFGASDVAPSAAELEKDGLVVFPTVITGAIPVYNLPKVRNGALVLDSVTLAGIFSGGIGMWNDERIKALNPGFALPAQPITVIVRADGSGTTYNFSEYLAKTNDSWKNAMGVGTLLKWPKSFIAVKGSKSVAEAVATTSGSIGYVDYNYVVDHALDAARMRLKDGSVVEGSPTSFRSALMQSAWWRSGDFTQPLTDIRTKGAWPITMGTFVVMPKTVKNAEQAAATLRFFVWAFNFGDNLANRTSFVRLPDVVQAKAFRAMSQIQDGNGVPLAVGAIAVRPPDMAAAR